MPRREAPPARVTMSRTAPEPSRSSAPTPARTAALVADGRTNDVQALPSSGSLRSRPSRRRGVPMSAAAPKAVPRATPGASARMAADGSARSSGSAASGGGARTKATPGACRRIAVRAHRPVAGRNDDVDPHRLAGQEDHRRGLPAGAAAGGDLESIRPGRQRQPEPAVVVGARLLDASAVAGGRHGRPRRRRAGAVGDEAGQHARAGLRRHGRGRSRSSTATTSIRERPRNGWKGDDG